MNTLQECYNKLIRMSNLNFVQSEEPMFAALQRELLSKAEAFEAAADCLYDKFRKEITPHESMRFISIRDHHLMEESNEEHRTDKIESE